MMTSLISKVLIITQIIRLNNSSNTLTNCNSNSNNSRISKVWTYKIYIQCTTKIPHMVNLTINMQPLMLWAPSNNNNNNNPWDSIPNLWWTLLVCSNNNNSKWEEAWMPFSMEEHLRPSSDLRCLCRLIFNSSNFFKPSLKCKIIQCLPLWTW